MLLKKPTNKPLYTSCTGMLLIGLNDALLVPISWAGMEGAKGGFAVAQTEAAGPLLLFGVPMPWPIHCHAILQKGSSLKKMEMLKGLYARGVKVFRPALTETDNIYCVSVCQMRYVQGDFNFRQLSSYFVMISGMAKEKKKNLQKEARCFCPCWTTRWAEAHRNGNPWGSAPSSQSQLHMCHPLWGCCSGPTRHVFFIMCDTELSFQITLVCSSEEQV